MNKPIDPAAQTHRVFGPGAEPPARACPVPSSLCKSAGRRGCTGGCASTARPTLRVGTPVPQDTAIIPADMLDLLMPLHVRLQADGRILSCGPTLQKVLGRSCQWLDFLDVFEVRRPGGVHRASDLAVLAGRRLALALRGAAEPGFRGMVVPMAGEGELLVNLAFGMGLVDAVAAYRLTDADFAPTDMAIDLLWMAEAKTAVVDAMRDLTERLQRARNTAEAQAMTDTLTGLHNRRALEVALERLARTDARFAVMHIDLDHFKRVNDTLGHAAGDMVLRRVGEIVSSTVRRGDVAARVGGDEFVAIFPGLLDRPTLRRIADRLVERISDPVDFHGTACRVSASIGISLRGGTTGGGTDELLAQADAALYAAKRGGRGRALFCDQG